MTRYITIVLLAAPLLFYSCKNSGSDESGNLDQTSETRTVEQPVSGTADEYGKAVHITKADFLARIVDYETNQNEWVYRGDKPAIVDFYADWCGPCKIASPVLDELAEEFKDDIYIFKVDTDVERELSAVFGIRSIPSFLFIPQNGRPTMSSGIAQTPEQTKEMFRQMIDELLLNPVPVPEG